MYSWWEYGVSPPWYGMIFGPLMMFAFIVLTVLIVAWVLHVPGLGWKSSAQGDSALELLKERFARGEIDRAEYEERKHLLSGS